MNNIQTGAPFFALLQLDGTAHEFMVEAMRRGMAPNLAKMAKDPNYIFQPYLCGVPTETEPVLAKVAYGLSIAGNDWRDPKTFANVDGVLFEDVIKKEAAANGESGLFQGGMTCICELSMGASESNTRVVRHTLYSEFARIGKIRTVLRELGRDLPALIKHPIELAGIIARFTANALYTRRYLKAHGLWNTWYDKHYPLMIAASDYIFPKLITANLAQALRKGLPRFFADFTGPDERRHYFGDSVDSLRSIELADHEIGRIVHLLEKSGRPYQLVIYADHGQSPTTLFTKAFGLPVTQAVLTMAAVCARRDVPATEIATAHDYPLLNIYFQDRKSVSLSSIEAKYPGLLAQIIAHPAFGFVAGREGGGLRVIGKNGQLVITGDCVVVTGEHPLKQYTDRFQDEKTLSRQLALYANVEGSGDLILNSAHDTSGNLYDFCTDYSLVSGHGGFGIKPPFILCRKDSGISVDGVIDATELHPQFKRLAEVH